MLFFSILFLILGIFLYFKSWLSPMDILCFFAAIFFALCFVLSLVRKAIWRIIRKPVAILAAIALVVMAVTAVPILFGVDAQADAPCDYLIVLGCRVDGDSPSTVLQDRINAAYDYLSAHPDTVCVASGGKGDDENISEAQCISDALIARGIAPERIISEDAATSTTENFTFSLARIAQRADLDTVEIGVLSSEFHLYRASLIAQANDLQPVFIEAPTTSTAARVGYTIREIFVLWKYLLVGE